MEDQEIARVLREHVQPLSGSSADYDSLLALVGNSQFVLIGEASHGTHEFYARAPLERQSASHPEEIPETFPAGV